MASIRILGREPPDAVVKIVEHRRIGVFLDRQRRRGVTDEQRHARPRSHGPHDEFRDFRGQIDKAGARCLDRQQRRHERIGDDADGAGAGEDFDQVTMTPRLKSCR